MKDLAIRLCMPNGFCAGVERAIQIVVLALKKYGPPVYVRHEIVHNRFVVEALMQKGAIFIDELSQIPAEHHNQPVIFSAHGVPKSVHNDAQHKNLFYLDATCPLVSKVHKQAIRHHRLGNHILLIGHAGHPEVVGTMGQVPKGEISLIETIDDAMNFSIDVNKNYGYVTQTTLSLEDTHNILEILHRRIANLVPPAAESICYATTNRQKAVEAAARDCEFFFVIGSQNSSNSKRLVEVALRSGAQKAMLLESVDSIPWQDINAANVIGISAGASAPKILLNRILEAFKARYIVKFEIVETVKEYEKFLLSKELRNIELEASDMEFLNG